MALPVRIVLLRPRNPENVGAAARALKNFGLTDWAWVRPAFEDEAPARRLAVHAEELLERAHRPATLDEAVEGCVWVVGTSSRGREGKRRIDPRAFAREAAERAGEGRTALLFGDERSGMSNEEIDRCHDLCGIPTDAAQPSINLAQAVLLFAWELRMAELERAERTTPPRAAAARAGELGVLEHALEEALRARGFLVQTGRHGARDLLATLVRARLTAREARLWTAALRVLGQGRSR